MVLKQSDIILGNYIFAQAKNSSEMALYRIESELFAEQFQVKIIKANNVEFSNKVFSVYISQFNNCKVITMPPSQKRLIELLYFT